MRTSGHPHTLPKLRAQVSAAMKDHRVTEREAKVLVNAVRKGGVTAAEKRVLSTAVRSHVDGFDAQAQARLFAVGARWTAAGNDPAVMTPHAARPYQASFGQLFVHGVSPRDVKQGQTGDCYFLSVAASLAQVRPGFLKQALVPQPDGSVAVRFFRQGAAGAAEPVVVRVDRDLVKRLGAALYAHGAEAHELWPALLEKAYAQLRGGFEVIGHAGQPSDAVFALTGQCPTTVQTSTTTPAALLEHLARALGERRPVVASTSEAQGSPGIVPAHAYSVLGLVQRASGPRVQVRNPWGYREPGATHGGDGVFELPPAAFQRTFPWLTC